MRMTLLKWHDMQDIPKYEKLLIVLYYNCSWFQYRIATYWESDNLFHEENPAGVIPRALQTDNIVGWAYLPLIVEKTTNNEVD